MKITKKDCQVLWVYGALERLTTLGYLEYAPIQVSQAAIDLFLQVDNNRDILFETDQHLISLIKLVCKDFNIDAQDTLIDMIFAYKNDRERLVKFALEEDFCDR